MAPLSPEVRGEMDSQGYALIRAHFPERPSFEALSAFGEISRLPGLNPIQILAPRIIPNSTPNTYSGNFGWNAFPLHTDLAHWYVPPRYLALRCSGPSSSVGTRILDSAFLIEQFGVTALNRALLRPRRPIQGCRPLLRLLENRGFGLSAIRWDSLFVSPASQESSKLFDAIGVILGFAQPKEVVLADKGDTLIIDNWRLLHGRSPVSASQADRRIERAYFGELT